MMKHQFKVKIVVPEARDAEHYFREESDAGILAECVIEMESDDIGSPMFAQSLLTHARDFLDDIVKIEIEAVADELD